MKGTCVNINSDIQAGRGRYPVGRSCGSSMAGAFFKFDIGAWLLFEIIYLIQSLTSK